MTPIASAPSAPSVSRSAVPTTGPAASIPEATVQQALQAVVHGAIQRHAQAQAEVRARAAAHPLRARNAQD